MSSLFLIFHSIAFSYNTAPHEGIASVTAFQIFHGSDPRNTLVSSLQDPPLLTEDEELALPTQFAEAVALSTRVFAELARTHDVFVRSQTAVRLNKKGTSRVFQVGEKVKVRVPPTQSQLLETGRRAKHVTAWRGPCTVLERLSTTSYAVIDDITKRRYERVIANMLLYRATKAKTNASSAQFSEVYSQPFVEGEFIAIRDDVSGPYYVAEIMTVDHNSVNLHYYGCAEVVLASAVFRLYWHEIASNEIVLDTDCPQPYDDHITFILSEF